MTDTMKTAADNVDKLGCAASRAADALDRIATNLAPSAFGSGGLNFAAPGQSGGWYPGKGTGL
jgi:hypothetical protein